MENPPQKYRFPHEITTAMVKDNFPYFEYFIEHQKIGFYVFSEIADLRKVYPTPSLYGYIGDSVYANTFNTYKTLVDFYIVDDRGRVSAIPYSCQFSILKRVHSIKEMVDILKI